MYRIIFTALLFCYIGIIQGQSKFGHFLDAQYSCPAGEEQAKAMQDPAYAALQEQKEKQYRKDAIRLVEERKLGVEQKNPPVYTLPVVVHVIHSGAELGTETNPTDASIINDITTASQRFRHQHTGAVDYSGINPLYGVDTEIAFCMASTDPDGNYTTGIVRHVDADLALFDYGSGESVSEYYATRWPIADYLNIFIIETLNGASGVYFGSADATFYDSGVFWSGLIAHEVGHHLNLRHTFQGACTNNNCLSDGDAVCDTPPKASSGFNGASNCAAPNDGCTTDEDDISTNNPYRPTANGGIGNQPDMIANYMDYTGSCWDAFTQGQKDRMRSDLENFRVDLINSSGCNVSTAPANDAGITAVSLSGSACASTSTPTVILNNYGTATLSTVSILLYVDGVLNSTYPWTGTLAAGATLSVTLPDVSLAVGNYQISATTSNPNNSADGFTNNDTAYTTYSVAGSATLPYAENMNSGTFPPTGVSLDNADNGVTWVGSSNTNSDCSTGVNTVASVNNFNYNGVGQRDIFRLPILDLSGYSSATLTFDVAYAPYSATYSDGLNVEISNACATPTVEYTKSGLVLATNNPQAYVTDAFVPTCTEWRNEIINLDAYTGAGFTQVLVDFVNINGWGNFLFIDNINLTAVSGCAPTVSVATPITSGTTVYSASDLVEGNNVISGAGTNVTFSGTNAVDLNNGFCVELGAEFLANNDGCGSPLLSNSNSLTISTSSVSTTNATIDIFLAQTDKVNLTLWNTEGNPVLNIKTDAEMTTGNHQVSIDTTTLKNGAYYLVLKTEKGTLVQNIVVLK